MLGHFKDMRTNKLGHQIVATPLHAAGQRVALILGSYYRSVKEHTETTNTSSPEQTADKERRCLSGKSTASVVPDTAKQMQCAQMHRHPSELTQRIIQTSYFPPQPHQPFTCAVYVCACVFAMAGA